MYLNVAFIHLTNSFTLRMTNCSHTLSLNIVLALYSHKFHCTLFVTSDVSLDWTLQALLFPEEHSCSCSVECINDNSNPPLLTKLPSLQGLTHFHSLSSVSGLFTKVDALYSTSSSSLYINNLNACPRVKALSRPKYFCRTSLSTRVNLCCGSCQSL